MGASPYFSSMHHKDIYKYYLALRTFFEVTEIKHDRSNSPRAQKARAKLLKLSASQFYELSTDVYDELQRRINEDQAQPEYLLPKASFHIKRNQARQKLANLSQTRFNDLVDDILFEIRRRGYDNFDDHNRENDQEGLTAGKSSDELSHIQSGDTSRALIPPTTAVQTSQVIPKKASIDWSSDEEENYKNISINTKLPEHEKKLDEVPEGQNFETSNSAKQNDSSYEEPQQIGTPVTKTVADNYIFTDPNDTPYRSGAKKIIENVRNPNLSLTVAAMDPIDSMKDLSCKLSDITATSLEKAAKSKPDTHNLVDETSVLKAKLEEKEKEIPVLKAYNPAENGLHGTLPNLSHQKELSSLSSQVSALSIENENLKQQISEMEFRSRHSSSSKIDPDTSVGLLQLLDKLQERYPLDQRSISKYVSADGSIPFNKVKNLNNLILLLYATLQKEKEDIGKELFENLAKLSNAISDILMLVDVPDFKDEVVLLKASLSHTITAVRYYSIFSSLLPKITVQAAISELSFSICRLLDSCGIKAASLQIPPEKSLKDSFSDPNVPQSLSPPMKDSVQKPNGLSTYLGDAADEMSPVKPLKITQRANMSPNPITSSSRKPSGNLLFSMIDRKSPLPSSRSSKTNFNVPLAASQNISSSEQPEHETNKNCLNENSGNKLAFLSSTPSKREDFKESATSSELSGSTSINNLKNQPAISPDPYLETEMDTPTNKNRKTKNSSIATSDLPPNENHDQNGSRLTSDIKIVSPGKENKAHNPTPSARSFTEKLNSFANGPGIGLRVEKPVKDTLKILPQSDAAEEATGKIINAKAEQVDKKDPVETAKIIQPITVEKNTSPSKLTEKLRKTFESLSDDDDDSNGGNDVNNNSNLSDDGETYLELKKSLKKNDATVGPHVIKKATVFSPRAQTSEEFGNENKDEPDPGSDLNSQPSFINKLKEEVAHSTNPDVPSKQGQESNQTPLESKQLKQVNGSTFKKQHSVDSDEYSDYQFIPLKKDNSDDLNLNESPEVARKSEHLNKEISHEKKVDPMPSEDREVDFNFEEFDIENPDNTLSELLLYLEHQTVEVISTIQSLLSSIKEPHATKGDLRNESSAINQVINQMVGATSVSMNQSRNASLKEHGNWVVKSLEDCSLRMITLCQLSHNGKVQSAKGDGDFADKNFKQRLAGIAFDVAKCTKELVKTVEEASLKEEIAFLNSRLN